MRNAVFLGAKLFRKTGTAPASFEGPVPVLEKLDSNPEFSPKVYPFLPCVTTTQAAGGVVANPYISDTCDRFIGGERLPAAIATFHAEFVKALPRQNLAISTWAN
ncbi:hypothetical protein Rcae01_05612 [Novipirellula caenicola]|uniref:Uncharacterized protein n=1 Tax=Novipirellula caenicola TaxID=1536901 RepID=A0ABP9VYC7_9BACT